jgi:hypothetical protein
VLVSGIIISQEQKDSWSELLTLAFLGKTQNRLTITVLTCDLVQFEQSCTESLPSMCHREPVEYAKGQALSCILFLSIFVLCAPSWLTLWGSSSPRRRSTPISDHQGCARSAGYSLHDPSHFVWSAGSRSEEFNWGRKMRGKDDPAIRQLRGEKHALDDFRCASDSMASRFQPPHSW